MKIKSIQRNFDHNGDFSVTWMNGETYYTSPQTLFKLKDKQPTIGIGLVPVLMLGIDDEVIECRHNNSDSWRDFKELYPNNS